MLEITCVPVGMLQSNSYIVKDTHSGQLALIDVGAFNRAVRSNLEAAGGDLRYILLTHGHFDHIQGAAAAKAQYPTAQLAIGAEDAAYLRGEVDTLPGRPSFHKCPIEPDLLLHGGDELPLGESLLRVIATPGHTPGGLCFHSEAQGLLFSGDTLFREEVGRVDLPGGDWQTLLSSIRQLFALPPSEVLPGHGPATSLAHERVHNPYVKA